MVKLKVTGSGGTGLIILFSIIPIAAIIQIYPGEYLKAYVLVPIMLSPVRMQTVAPELRISLYQPRMHQQQVYLISPM